MAYEKELAARLRLAEGEPGLSEKKMFGGLAFVVGGNMAITASGEGGIMVRADPDEAECLLTTTELGPWVDLTLRYARSLPAK